MEERISKPKNVHQFGIPYQDGLMDKPCVKFGDVELRGPKWSYDNFYIADGVMYDGLYNPETHQQRLKESINE